MDTEKGGDELEAATITCRGKKRPPSPASPPRDGGEDSPMSTTVDDDDDDGWNVSEEEGEDDDDDDDEDQGTGLFKVNDFPRFSSDHFEQTSILYRYPGIYRRGPSPLSLYCALKDYPVTMKDRHWFAWEYRLNDESEISLNNAGTIDIDCSKSCHCKPTDFLQLIDLKISGYLHTQPGHAKIFGFFAARDKIEPLRNYVYRRDIVNYEAVPVNRKTGMARLSLTSPARGILISSHALFEFELCIRTEDPSEDEPKGDILIKGCTEIDNMFGTESFVKTGLCMGRNVDWM